MEVMSKNSKLYWSSNARECIFITRQFVKRAMRSHSITWWLHIHKWCGVQKTTRYWTRTAEQLIIDQTHCTLHMDPLTVNATIDFRFNHTCSIFTGKTLRNCVKVEKIREDEEKLCKHVNQVLKLKRKFVKNAIVTVLFAPNSYCNLKCKWISMEKKWHDSNWLHDS